MFNNEFFSKKHPLVEQKTLRPIVMQCKSLYYATITDVSTPYNRAGINHASPLYADTVKTLITISASPQ
jgi:hypothetical protein